MLVLTQYDYIGLSILGARSTSHILTKPPYLANSNIKDLIIAYMPFSFRIPTGAAIFNNCRCGSVARRGFCKDAPSHLGGPERYRRGATSA